MEAAVLQTWLPILLGLINLGGIIWVWLTSQSKTNATEIRDLQAVINSQARQIQALEQSLKQVPDQKAVHDIDLKVSELNGSMGILAESMKSVQRTAQRIETFLLEQAGTKK